MDNASITIKTLVQGFAQNLKQLKAPDYKESQVRLQYIDPFWEFLGWDIRNEKQCPPQDVEVIIEPSMDTMEDNKFRSRMPDYLFRLNGFGRFVVEAKKPAVDIDTDRRSIFQAKRYAWNATIPFAILMDFEQFRLYDTTLKPSLNEPERGLIRDFSLNFPDYPSKWEELIATFGRDAVAGGSLERLRAKIRNVPSGRRIRTVDRMLFDLKGDEPVDRVFLDYLEKYRQRFAAEIFKENKKEFPDADTLHGAAKLTEAVQRLIDRLVFMRVCEDRGISRWGVLRDLLDRVSNERGDFYKALALEFRDLDREFNGYLFKYHFSDALEVPADILADFVRNLYPPEAPWDFSVIGDDILGIVYERFLGNIVTVRLNQAVVEEKPEVRHAGGVYYTPRFVVNTIIRRVIGPQIVGKTPLQALDVKVLDPACGSGSFLVAAFQYLIDHCLSVIAADPSLAKVPATPKARKKHKEIAFQDKKKRWHLAPDFKADLLTHCIHGVDIDQQAVEVTIMSLYLKMLEDELPPLWQQDWLENELLPSLDNNIICGNSLADSNDFDGYCEDKLGGLIPWEEDVKFRINRFDWTSRTRGFGKLLDSQASRERGRAGFDCIVGNPPYIRVQELNKWAPDECEFYKWKYKSAEKGNYDIYVVFVERCLDLLSPEGLLGFIMPHKFWQAKYGEGLRKIITNGKHLRSLVDFGHQQVFRGATTYTAIHILTKLPNSGAVDYAKFDNLSDGVSQCLDLDTGKSVEGVARFAAKPPLKSLAWGFFDSAMSKLMDSIAIAGTLRLGDIADRLFQGIRTSKNEVYVLQAIDVKRGRYMSDILGREIELEIDILKPFLSADGIRRYSLSPPTAVVIFPYTTTKSTSGIHLLPAATIKHRYPRTWNYLQACEGILRGREERAFDHDGWYGYGRTQNLDLFGIPRVLVPDMMDRASFALDMDGNAAFVSGYGIILKSEYIPNLTYLTGLLNSKLLNLYLKSISTPLRGGWFRTFPQFLRQIPIKLPKNPAEKKLAMRIAESVHAIMEAKVKLRSPKLSDRERKVLDGDVELHERRIDKAVLALYGVESLPDA
jgi:type I restriction-modification system DNA methylase subunit